MNIFKIFTLIAVILLTACSSTQYASQETQFVQDEIIELKEYQKIELTEEEEQLVQKGVKLHNHVVSQYDKFPTGKDLAWLELKRSDILKAHKYYNNYFGYSYDFDALKENLLFDIVFESSFEAILTSYELSQIYFHSKNLLDNANKQEVDEQYSDVDYYVLFMRSSSFLASEKHINQVHEKINYDVADYTEDAVLRVYLTLYPERPFAVLLFNHITAANTNSY